VIWGEGEYEIARFGGNLMG